MLSRKDWLPERVIVIAVPLFALALMGLGSAVLQPTPPPPRSVPAFGATMLGTLGFQGALLLGVTWFLQSHRRGWAEAFGFPIAPWTSIARGIALALGVIPVAYALQWGSVVVLKQVGIPANPQSSVELLLRTGSGWQRACLALFAVGVAPAVEEMLFRGIFYTCLRDLGRPRMALVVSAVFFGLVHTNLPALLPLTAFGAALAWLYGRTGNLLACVAAHATFNLVPFLMLALGWKFGEAGGAS